MKFSELEQMVLETREILDSHGIEDDDIKVFNNGNYTGSFDLYAVNEYGFVKTILRIE
jgi:hypothetical protein